VIKYAITDPSFFNVNSAKEYYTKLQADYLLYRDKKSNNYQKDATKFIEDTKNYNFKKIIHQDYNLANRLNCHGVHLSSTQFNDIAFAKELNLFTIISTHTLEEIKIAKDLGADAVTYSPIFSTPNKGEPKGIDALNIAINCCNIKVIALGGIVLREHIEQIASTNAWGFASIRYFKP